MALPKAKIRVQHLFNRIAGPYARQVLPRARAEARRDLEWLRPQPHEQALDLACGPGTLGLELAPRTRVVYGIDLADRMIALARRGARARHRANAHFAVAEAERLPLPDEVFDLVACSYSFPSFPAPQRIIAEMCRVTRPGGRIGVLEVVAPKDETQRRRLNRLEEMRSQAPTRFLCLEDLVALFTQAGLHLLDCHVEERPRQLKDWLALGHPGNDRRRRRALRELVLRSAKTDALGLHPARHRRGWIFFHTVARLLWRK
ncbi:MAG: methyltransferase domain-containing protein [Candidatus Acidoferrales bacterium]